MYTSSTISMYTCNIEKPTENINKRLSSLSSSEEEFNTTIQPYQEALSNSGYDYKLKYNPTPKSNKNNKNRNL